MKSANGASARPCGRQRRGAVALVLVGAVVLLGGWPAGQAATDAGYRDFSYGGGGASAPSGEKPQSKLWFHDGSWWGSLFKPSASAFTIHRFDWATHTWVDTGTVIDTRDAARMDCLWDGVHLYVATAGRSSSSSSDSGRVLRFRYDAATRTYALDPGFPVAVTIGGMEAIVLAKDTTGKLGVTYTQGARVRVNRSTGSDATWGTPFDLPVAGTTAAPDDISAIVAFGGQVGVMWSNQTDETFYFATHADGAADSAWSVAPALQGPGYADDHISLRSLQADASGRVFAAVKTSLGDSSSNPGSAPQILLLVLDHQDSWRRHTFGTVADNHTRPIVLIDEEHRRLYMFARGNDGSAKAILYKESGLDNIAFPTGAGTPFIRSGADPDVNNPTSTKQNLSGATGLLVLASDDSTGFYLHNTIDLDGSGGTTSTPSPTAAATLSPTPTGNLSTMTFAPVADARVESANPGANFGASKSLATDGGTTADESYLRFEVSGVSGPVVSATLRLFATTDTVDGPAAYATGGGWTETGITWDTRPARTGGALDDKGAIAPNTWVEFDVTALVTADGGYDLVLAQASTDGVTFNAREAAANGPALVLTVDSAATASPTPTATAESTATPATTEPTATPSPTATATPIAAATATPIAAATATATATPSPTSTPEPTATATVEPTATSTPIPTATPEPTPTPVPPTGPSDMTATAVTQGGRPAVDLRWTDAAGEDGYQVWRCTVQADIATDCAKIKDLAAGTTTLRDRKSLAAGATYEYYLVAFNAGGAAESNRTRVTIP